jgi:diguanylate cyclase (GGDEF)-like protein
MMDIDYFKSYNDTYGHLAGDDCLRKVTDAVVKALRASDFPARFGGEEFACILPETDEEGAWISAERIREHVAAAGIPHGASPVAPHITISLGVATILPDEDTEPEALIAMADCLLYKAKNSGRNRVMQ